VQQEHARRFAELKQIHIKSKSTPEQGEGPASRVDAEKLTVQTAVSMVSAGKMKFKDETHLRPGKASEDQFPDREGFWIISAMGHAIAVCFRSGPKGKVFEPNFGQGVFATYADCRRFISALTDEDENYKNCNALLFVKEFSG
jgi:hypothetical protein